MTAIAAPLPSAAARPHDRDQTPGEELANAISHGLGCLMAIGALPLLVSRAVRDGTTGDVVGASLFGATMVLLYLVSTIFHSLPNGRAKHWFNRMDHAAIYLFIAGSYMPYLFGALRGAWGWSLFGVVTGAAVVGVVAKMFRLLNHPLWSTGLYVAMGWVALIAAAPLVAHLSFASLAWLVGGGVAYTAGAVVFMVDGKYRYAHAVWHLFVMAGSACHVMAALGQIGVGR